MQNVELKRYLIDNFWAVALIVLGSFAWSLTMIKSGLVYDFGMGFWGPNGHDGVWHIALIRSLADGSWNMPIFAGEAIQNYHIGFDLLLAAIHKLTFIPVKTLYFQILPPVLALGIGSFVYRFVLAWTKSKTSSFWATFFVYFGGSFGWVVTLVRDGQIGGESMFWAQQSISTLINPPFATSLLFIFLALSLLLKGIKNGHKKYLMLSSFLFGVLVQIKVYAGILALGGLFLAGIWQMYKREGFSVIKVFTGATIISILIFFPTTGDIGNTIVFKPFWFLEEMMSSADRVYWPRFASAMVNYKLAGNWIKGPIAYGAAFLIFIVGNFATRIIKEPMLVKKIKNINNLSYIEVFLISVTAAGVVIPLFFIQSGTPWNTIQFMYYSLMLSGVLAGTALGKYLEKARKEKYDRMIYHTKVTAPVLLIVVLTLPTAFSTLYYHYLPSRPPAKISNEELEALKFLERQPDGVVLTLPFDKSLADAAADKPPRPLYLYESTAYVSAFSGKSVYLEDEVNLEITGYSWKERREELQDYLDNHRIAFLGNNNISYLYFVKPLNRYFVYSGTFERVFTNDEVDIFRVYDQ